MQDIITRKLYCIICPVEQIYNEKEVILTDCVLVCVHTHTRVGTCADKCVSYSVFVCIIFSPRQQFPMVFFIETH